MRPGGNAGRMNLHLLSRAVLAAVLAVLEPVVFQACSSTAQLVAGGSFSKAAVSGIKALAQWHGILAGSNAEWLRVGTTSFGASEDVRVLTFDPSQRWLIVGGTYFAGELQGSLLRTELPSLSEFKALQFFFKFNAEGKIRPHGEVYALEYRARPHDDLHAAGEAWDLFIGGDFDKMSNTKNDPSPVTARFVARCVFKREPGSLYGSPSFTSLPPNEPEQAQNAPNSPVHMLAFDNVTQTLYTGGQTGPLRKYHLPSETWSLLEQSVGVGATGRPLSLMFDSKSGFGFISFHDTAAEGEFGVRVFKRAETSSGISGGKETADAESMLRSEHITALTAGTDPTRGRGVFAAGNRSHCPTLWFLPFEGQSSMTWQDRGLQVAVGGCPAPNVEGENIVKRLAFTERDKVLILAGNFQMVSGVPATNIAMSRDAGTSWSALWTDTVGEGLKDGTVSDVIVIPQIDVTVVEPVQASPFGNSLLTVHGSGFHAFPRWSELLKVTVGGSECAVVDWQSDVKLTCKVSRGFGDSLQVSAGLPWPGSEKRAFQRQTYLFSYSAPILGADGALTAPVTSSIGGDELITVLGKNFGYTKPENSIRIEIGESTCDDATWTSDSSIRCRLSAGAAGAGNHTTTNLVIKARFSSRSDEQTSVMRFSYLAPLVTQLKPAVVPTTGMSGFSITLLGKSFGSSRDVQRSTRLGETTCDDNAGWTSDSSVACRAPGPGVGFLPLSLVVASQTCTSGCSFSPGVHNHSLLRYAPPTVTGVQYDLPPEGGGVITIAGTGFGHETLAGKGFGDTVRLGESECRVVDWSDNKIVCISAPGAGDQLNLSVAVRGQIGVAGELLKYRDPVLDSFAPLLLPREGGVIVTVRGRLFAKDAVSLYAAVWVRTEDPSKAEYYGVIQAIFTVKEASEQEEAQQQLIIRTPEMPALGPAFFFVRARVSQVSNQLPSSGHACRNEAVGSAKACIHFSERSPLLSLDIASSLVSKGNGGTGEPVYDLSKWKASFALYLDMPTPELLFVESVVLRGGGRRSGWNSRDAGDKRLAKEEALEAGRRRASKFGQTQVVSDVRVQGGSEIRTGGGDLVTLREATMSLKVRLYLLSDVADPWSFQRYLDTLKARLNSAEGRQEVKRLLGITSVAVGSEVPITIGTEDASGGKTNVQIPQAKDGFICVGGSNAGQPCAGDASSFTPEQAEMLCPGGGSCVKSGDVGVGITGQWSFGAIIGAFLVAGMAVIAVGMKVSADHRRKKRSKEASRSEALKKESSKPQPNAGISTEARSEV